MAYWPLKTSESLCTNRNFIDKVTDEGNDEACGAQFKRYRRSVDRHIRRRHREFISNVGASLEASNTKPFWNYIKMIPEFQC